MPKPLGVRIAGTGCAVPSRVLDNEYFTNRLDTTDEWIRERTGIQERRVVGADESTATLAIDAARQALSDSGLSGDDLDMIIVATITGECPFPATACFVQTALTKNEIPAFDLSAACSGYIYALVVATNLLQTGVYKNILIIGSETMSRVTDYEDRASCILFGDGAGATVLTAVADTSGPALLYQRMHTDGSGASMLWVPAGGSRLPASRMTVDERLHYLKMQGREVYKFAVKKMLEMIDVTLTAAGITPDDLAMVIPHQSNRRIIESARQRLGLPPEKMYVNIDRLGNTSAASIPIGLDEVRRTGRVRSGDLVLLVAFGAGLTWASALLRI
jgi:3-oxoacyl-[acyl-carrier-protein] synthase-3